MSQSELDSRDTSASGWLHRLAVLLVCLVWPLIWVGGLVTTYDAGMAVPDWPNTYGYNLFLYPYETWLLGPFDLFIEHGHRLLAAVVGFVAIGLTIVAVYTEPRRWVRWLALSVLVAVILQGVLGGLRVVLSDRTLAMLHGCLGPAFFALCVVMAAVSGRWWGSAPARVASLPGERKMLGRGVVIAVGGLVVLSYIQLVLGAQLRHVQPTMSPIGFTHIVKTHVVVALGLWLLTGFVWSALRKCGDLTLSRPTLVLIGLVAIQILLGIATWVVNYGWPTILQWVPGSSDYIVQSKGFAESIIVTAHVATGSLILAVSTLAVLRVARMRDVLLHPLS